MKTAQQIAAELNAQITELAGGAGGDPDGTTGTTLETPNAAPGNEATQPAQTPQQAQPAAEIPEANPDVSQAKPGETPPVVSGDAGAGENLEELPEWARNKIAKRDDRYDNLRSAFDRQGNEKAELKRRLAELEAGRKPQGDTPPQGERTPQAPSSANAKTLGMDWNTPVNKAKYDKWVNDYGEDYALDQKDLWDEHFRQSYSSLKGELDPIIAKGQRTVAEIEEQNRKAGWDAFVAVVDKKHKGWLDIVDRDPAFQAWVGIHPNGDYFNRALYPAEGTNGGTPPEIISILDQYKAQQSPSQHAPARQDPQIELRKQAASRSNQGKIPSGTSATSAPNNQPQGDLLKTSFISKEQVRLANNPAELAKFGAAVEKALREGRIEDDLNGQ